MVDLESPGKPVYIYALCDPDSLLIRYIGKSIRPAERIMNHMNDHSRCHRTNWLQGLKTAGKEPVPIILETILGA